MSAPVVSVCIRAYARPADLRRAIASALAQSYGDLEVVVCDDSRRLGDVAAGFGDPRVRYFANAAPLGPAGNLAAAFGRARGRILAILNEDDAWLPSFLATVVDRFEADPDVGVVFTGAFFEFAGRRAPLRPPFAPGRHDHFLVQVLDRGLPASGVALRREVWEQAQRRRALADGMVADLYLWLSAAEAGWPFHYVDEPLAVLGVHPDQVSWDGAFPTRAIETLNAFGFGDPLGEALRRARLAEAHLSRARVLLHGRRAREAAVAIGAAREVAPARLGARALLSVTGVRETSMRRGAAHPWLLAPALAVWGRLRPPVLPAQTVEAVRSGPPGIGWDVRHPRLVAAAERVARLLVAPLLVAHRARLVSFMSGGQLLSLVPGALGLMLRRVWYRATLERCGERLRVAFGTVIHQAGARIGDDCSFGELNRIGLADIGSNFMSANHVSVISGRDQHGIERRDVPIQRQRSTLRRVVVGEDVWAGAHATIAADVAAHSVVGSGAVVTRSFPEWSVLGGVPAQVIRERP